MKSIKLTLFLLAVIVVSVSAPGCNRSSGGKRVIAVIPKGVAHFFWQSVHAGADAAGKEFGVEVMWKGPAQETDYSGQINIVEDAINRRVDGIVLAPSHGDALVPIVERAQREGIPVTIFDSGISTETYLSYVATDNRQGGVVAAERLAEKLGGKGNVAILGVKAGSVSTDEREQAMSDFEALAAADALEALADEIQFFIDRRMEEAYRKALDVYYTAEELARDPEHAELVPHVEAMRRAHEQQYGKAIPPKQ